MNPLIAQLHNAQLHKTQLTVSFVFYWLFLVCIENNAYLCRKPPFRLIMLIAWLKSIITVNHL